MKNKNKIIGVIIAVGVLALGYVVWSGKGTLFTGKFAIQPGQLQPACPGPYHRLVSKNQCVWSCGLGTQPDNPSNRFGQCVCQPGYVESGADSFGRRICKLSSTPPPPPPPPPIAPPPSVPVCPELPPLPPGETPPPSEPPSTSPITTGPLSVSLAPTTPSSTLFEGNNQRVELAHFRLTVTSSAEGLQITDITITNVSTAATSFYSVGLFDFDNGEQIGGFQNFSGTINGTTTFSGLDYRIPAGAIKTLIVKASPVAYPSGTSNSDHTIRIAPSAIIARGVESGDVITAPSASVNSNTHTWARTTLSVTGGVVPGHCASGCVRSSVDNILRLNFTSGSSYGATFRSCTNDGIIIHFSGNLASAETIRDLPVEMVDFVGNVRAVGYIHPIISTVAQAVLKVSSGSDIVFSTAPSAYRIRVDTSRLLAADTTAGESLSVVISLGDHFSNGGDIRWYDGAVGVWTDPNSSLTWVSGYSPITANYAY